MIRYRVSFRINSLSLTLSLSLFLSKYLLSFIASVVSARENTGILKRKCRAGGPRSAPYPHSPHVAPAPASVCPSVCLLHLSVSSSLRYSSLTSHPCPSKSLPFSLSLSLSSCLSRALVLSRTSIRPGRAPLLHHCPDRTLRGGGAMEPF
jgi:hypothetical protein